MQMTIHNSENGLNYKLVGDYYLPIVSLSEKEKAHLGVWGMRRKNYLLNNNRVLFSIMLADGSLWNNLTEIDKRAEEMFSRLVDEIAKAEGVTEGLKATDQMVWMGKMNNIRQRAIEIVNNELIYT